MSAAPIDPQRRRLLRAGVGGALAAGVAMTVPRAIAGPRGTTSPIARVHGGRVAGQTAQDIHVFRGIPYGADTAPRRFQRALPPLPWRGVREALSYGPSAPQASGDGPGSEDCLYLNVWTPALRDGGKRPVLVYIHGGAYSSGSGSDPLYDGSALSRRGDVVVVTLNHRLNLFGYLHLARFGGEALADAGNVGQLDLIQALQWVRRHAAEFGGDAGNVTVFGQSGGGAKIATLMAMPEANGLFHRAWTMSGQQVTAAGPRAASQRAQLVLDHLRVDADALRRLPMEKLLEALAIRDPSRMESTRLYLGPVLDGRHLPAHPFWPQAPAQSAGVPMVIGNTHDETRAFLGHDPANFSLDWDELPARLDAQQYVDLSPEVVIDTYRRLYPGYTASEVFFAAITAGRSWRGAIEELEARARQGAPAWAYQLDWYDRHGEAAPLRAFHTLDIPLVFHNIHQRGARTGTGESATRMADTMSDALLAFARHGNPNHAGLPPWQPYTLARRQTLLFDTPSRQADDPRGGERQLYAQVPFIQRGTF